MAEYEYSLALNTAELKPGIAQATGDKLSQELTMGINKILQTAAKATETLEGGGWEIISHELTRVDRHLVLTFLLRRPKRSTRQT